MRKNQISIKIQRFGDEAPNGRGQTINIYADSNNIWEALAAANNLAATAITQTDKLPNFGVTNISIEE